MSPEPEYQVETWTYTGRRFTSDGKIAHVWHDADDESLWFPKAPKAPVLGGVYDVECIRQNGGKITARLVDARYASMGSDTRRNEWLLADRTAVAQQEAERSKARVRKEGSDLGDLTLREIRNALLTKPTNQRWGLLAHVMEYLR